MSDKITFFTYVILVWSSSVSLANFKEACDTRYYSGDEKTFCSEHAKSAAVVEACGENFYSSSERKACLEHAKSAAVAEACGKNFLSSSERNTCLEFIDSPDKAKFCNEITVDLRVLNAFQREL